MSAYFSSPPEFLLSVLGSPKYDNPHRPHVTLTFAQSLDAKIAGKGGTQLALSGAKSMEMTHWMRSMHDTIMIGIGTALNDDPQLNTRLLPPPPPGSPPNSSPRPVILDSRLRLPPTCRLLQNFKLQKGRRPWVITTRPSPESLPEWLARKEQLDLAGARVLPILKDDDSNMLSIPGALQALRDLGIQSVMVEGGATVIASFLALASSPSMTQIKSAKAVIDTLIITLSPTLVGDQGVAYNVNKIPNLKHILTETFDQDAVFALEVVHPY